VKLVLLLLEFAGHKLYSSGIKLEKRLLRDWSNGSNPALGLALINIQDEPDLCDDVFFIKLCGAALEVHAPGVVTSHGAIVVSVKDSSIFKSISSTRPSIWCKEGSSVGLCSADSGCWHGEEMYPDDGE